MSTEIQDIIDAIVVLQKAIPAPTGEKDITHAYDEQPESASTFPCFINIVRGVNEFERLGEVRMHAVLTVDMHLCFEQGSGIYADRSRRLWYQATMDYFDQHLGLGGTVQWAAIESVAFDEPLQVTETLRYPGIKFELRARMMASPITLAVDGAPAYDPAVTLGADMSAATTAAGYISTGDPIAKFDVIQIDSEQMVVANVNTTTNVLTVGRGYGGTTAATHTAGAAILRWGHV